MHIHENTHTEHENAELSRTRHYGVQVTACVFLMCNVAFYGMNNLKIKKNTKICCVLSLNVLYDMSLVNDDTYSESTSWDLKFALGPRALASRSSASKM